MKRYIKTRNFIITIVIIFVISIALIPRVFAAPQQEALDNLMACIADSNQTSCTLDGNITNLSKAIAINSSKEINLNGYKISGEGSGGGFFGINPSQNDGVNVKFTGTGTIEYTGTGETFTSISVYGKNEESSNVTHLTIDSNVTVINLGIAFFGRKNYPASYGVTVDFYGKIKNNIEGFYDFYVQGGIHNHDNAPVINVRDGAVITNENDVAIMQAGSATTNIYNATITGGSAIGIKSGNLNVYGGQITGKSNNVNASQNEKGQDVMIANGAAIQIKSTRDDYGHIAINLYDGTLKSDYNSAVFEHVYSSEKAMNAETKVESIKISGGKFISPSGVSAISVSDNFKTKNNHFVSGGTFSSDISTDFLTYGTIQTSDGKVMTESDYKKYLEAINSKNPNTSDNIIIYMILFAISIMGIAVTTFITKKNIRLK